MTSPDKNHLTIRCPSCSQKFKVGAELAGRMVECGACESRFTVNDEVIQKASKTYPGERNHDALKGFARVDGPKIGMDAATPIPRGPHEQGYFSPISKVGPLRLTAGWLGALLVFGTCAVLQTQLGIGELPVVTQGMIAVAAGVVGLGLIVWANPRNKMRSLLIGGVASVILLSVPFVFRSKVSTTSPGYSGETSGTAEPTKAEVPPENETVSQLRERLRLQPLEIEVQRLAESGSGMRVYGLWLRDMNESNRLSVRDYMLRSTAASPSSVIYPRDNREYLMVLTGLDRTIEQVAAVCAKIGRQTKIHPELQLIEVRVDASVFVEGPIDKLTDKGSPAFYDLNKRELESIQLDRVSRAVKRLADAEPKIYRDDITRHLVVLASMPQINFLEDVCRALLVWAEDATVANITLMKRLGQMHSEKKKIPAAMVAMLAKGKANDAIPIVEELWMADATNWEPLLRDFGQPVEKSLLARYPELEVTLRHSATRILGQVGTSTSLPVLEAARPKADPELVVLIDAAVRAIRERN